MSTNRFLAACALLVMVVPPTPALSQQPEASPRGNVRKHGVSFDFAHVNTPNAGVAAGQNIVFIGEPLNASVIGCHDSLENSLASCLLPQMDSRSRLSCIR